VVLYLRTLNQPRTFPQSQMLQVVPTKVTFLPNQMLQVVPVKTLAQMHSFLLEFCDGPIWATAQELESEYI
jgi:hypothetical protein